MTPDPWRSSTEVSCGLVSSAWRTCCCLACCPVSHCGAAVMSSTISMPCGASAAMVRSGPSRLPPWASAKMRFEAARLAQHVQCAGAPQFHETRPVTLRGQCRGGRVLVHRDDRDVGPRQQRGGYPGGACPGPGATLKHPGPGRQAASTASSRPAAGSQDREETLPAAPGSGLPDQPGHGDVHGRALEQPGTPRPAPRRGRCQATRQQHNRPARRPPRTPRRADVRSLGSSSPGTRGPGARRRAKVAAPPQARHGPGT
jgi:hypothetical protein